MHGTLSIIQADNPASSSLGGFKESASAFRGCRQCMASSDDMRKAFDEREFSLRTPLLHDQQCDELDAAEPELYEDLSKSFGINRRSILNDLQYFHVASGSLLPDVMHDMLEGVLQYETKLLLQHLILEDKYFSLDRLNSAITCVELGYMETSSRPSEIDPSTLLSDGHSLKQNGMKYIIHQVLNITCLHVYYMYILSFPNVVTWEVSTIFSWSVCTKR